MDQGLVQSPLVRPLRGTRRLASLATVLFAASFLVLLLCMDRRVWLYDEGIALFGAERVAGGDVLHRDFYTLYGPGQFYSLALLFKLFSPSVLVERLWDTAERSAVVVLVFLVVATAASRTAAWLAALAALTWLGALGFYGYPVFPALAASLASLLLLMPAFAGVRSRRRLLTAGLCVGLTGLFRYDVGVSVFSAESLVLGLCALWQAQTAGHRSRCLMGMVLPFWTGLGLVVLPLAAAYAAAGVLPDFVFDVVTFPAHFYPQTRSRPFPVGAELLASPSAISVYLPLLACALAAPAVLALVRHGRHTGRALQLWTLTALMALTLVFFAKGFVRVSPIHMAMAITSSVALIAVLWSARRGLGRAVRWGAAVGVLATAACTILEAGAASVDRQVVWLAPDPCHPPAGLERLACFTLDQPRVEAIQYVQQRTAPGEAIFVGLGRHDKILVNDVALYFLAGRRAATKWHDMNPGLQTTAPIQREMVAELSRAHPRFILLDSAWDAVTEPNASAISSGVTLLDDYLRNRFTPVATFGTLTVLQDTGPRASP